ncbi:MAG: AsmA family protein, partial [Rhodospirillales bacterium]|nr:AsmA family protein [Rhodospirillales bacterium]
MKKVLIGIVVLLVLLIGGALAAPSFIDWNSYKGQIADQAREATGRELSIDGDISLSLLWTPTLSVGKVRFANVDGASAPEMATLESLDVRLALTPLDWLDGNFQVERVELVQPTIVLEKLADGRTNWQFQEAGSAEAGTGGSAGGGRDIRLDSITITNGTLVYRDAATGQEQRIEALNADLGATSPARRRAAAPLSYPGRAG